MERRLDYIKPMILVHAGIVASSVAILVALIAGTASKDNDLYRPVFASAMASMAVVVVFSTIAVVLLQVLRFAWQLAPRLFETMPPFWLRGSFWLVVILVFCVFSWLTVSPGYDAAKYLFSGAANVVAKKNADVFLCPGERSALPWVLRRFYRGGPTGSCPP